MTKLGCFQISPPLLAFHVTDKEFDEGRLVWTVHRDSDTGEKRHLKSDIVELLNLLRGLLEAELAPELVAWAIGSRTCDCEFMRQIFRTFLTHDLHLNSTLLLILTPSRRGGSEAWTCNLRRLQECSRTWPQGLAERTSRGYNDICGAWSGSSFQVKDVRDSYSVVEEAGVVRNDDWNI